jgi:hypothetical protein
LHRASGEVWPVSGSGCLRDGKAGTEAASLA